MQWIPISGMQLLAFEQTQQNLIIALAVVLAVVFAANVPLFVVFYYKRKRGKLSTEELQTKREELLEELANLRTVAPAEKPAEQPPQDIAEEVASAEETEEEVAEDAEEEPDEEISDELVDELEEELEEEDGAETAVVDDDIAEEAEQSGGRNLRFVRILPVREMSALMREKFGFVGEEYDDKSYYVRYSYGFEAKLRAASENAKRYYAELIAETGHYRRIKVSHGFKSDRLYCGRKTVGVVLIKGKTLCVALALNPADYENTKYRGRDVSDKKRFAKTPMLVKITSQRRLGYVKYLLGELAKANGAERAEGAGELSHPALDALDRDACFAAGLLKITVIAEVPAAEKGSDADGGKKD